MPSWGRPSGAREGKRRKGDARRSRQWEADRRVEEIDSDDDDDNGQGVGLHGTYPGDELHFTGADLGLGIRNRQRRDHNYNYSSRSSEEENDSEGVSGGTMQLALRDKEEMLVQRALERIRRAQMLGRTNVKLTQPEIDALERKRRKDQAKSRDAETNSKDVERRRSTGYFGNTIKNDKLGKRGSKDLIPGYSKSGSSSPARATPPGMIVPGSDGIPSYAPFGYYPSSGSAPQGRSSRSGSRSTSSHNLQQLSPPLPPNQAHTQQRRYVSVPEPSQPPPSSRSPPLPRRLPDDPNWIPRPRSASSSQPYSNEPFQYQTHSPPLPQMPVQYSQGRRNVSGPPEVQYSSVRRVPPIARPYAASSDPSILRREYIDEAPDEANPSEDDSDYDDDAENSSVRVDVVPYGVGYGVNTGPELSARRRQGRSLR